MKIKIADANIILIVKILSSKFGENEQIPVKYTCDGENINPPLEFQDIPEGTASLVLIVDDPDAPSGDWVHWLVWNIDPNIRKIPENWHENQVVEGMTSFGKPGFGGPCPPASPAKRGELSGIHRYFFKLYALDKIADLPATVVKHDLLKAVENHVIAQAQLIGLYSR